jgi:hypothetical protein
MECVLQINSMLHAIGKYTNSHKLHREQMQRSQPESVTDTDLASSPTTVPKQTLLTQNGGEYG